MSDVVDGPVDVAVVGGGVVGLACALELARRGASVAVLERDRIGHGCSFGNAGWLTPSLALPLAMPGLPAKALRWMFDAESPFYVRPRLDPRFGAWLVRFARACRGHQFERNAIALVELAIASVDAWENLAARSATPFGFARAGLLSIHETAEGLAAGRAAAELVGRAGVPFEIWSAADVRAREPSVRADVAGAIHFPRDAHCEPDKAVAALAAAAVDAGARLHEQTEVVGAERRGSTIDALLTTRGRVEARDVVLAAGAWAGKLGRSLGRRLPIIGAKGYTVVVPPLDPQPRRSLMLAERKIALNPHADRLRISGTLELVGLDLSIDRRRVAVLLRSARALLALPETLPPIEPWAGLRPCTPDGMPAIGRARGARNLWLAIGHQMTGLKTAPASGRLLAELMAGEAPSFDPGPFRADRL